MGQMTFEGNETKGKMKHLSDISMLRFELGWLRSMANHMLSELDHGGTLVRTRKMINYKSKNKIMYRYIPNIKHSLVKCSTKAGPS